MPEGYNVALWENDAIEEAVEAFKNSTPYEISDSKTGLNKVYYRTCFAGVEYMFQPASFSQYLIRVFALAPGYSGRNNETYRADVFRIIPEGAKDNG